MTIVELKNKIEDFEKRAKNKSLPESAVKKLHEIIKADKEKLEQLEAKEAALDDMKGKDEPKKEPKYKAGQEFGKGKDYFKILKMTEFSSGTYFYDVDFEDGGIDNISESRISEHVKKTKTKKETEPKKPTTHAPEIPEMKKGDRMKVTKGLELVFVTENLYELVHDEVPEWEFERRKDGKWHVQCKDLKKHEFETLQEAVEEVAKTIYNEGLDELLLDRLKRMKANKKYQETIEKGGKDAVVSIAETIENANETVINKLEDKVEHNKPIAKDINKVIGEMFDGIEKFIKFAKSEKANIDKAKINKLIEDLKELL